jgi:hypothetical protein
MGFRDFVTTENAIRWWNEEPKQAKTEPRSGDNLPRLDYFPT